MVAVLFHNALYRSFHDALYRAFHDALYRSFHDALYCSFHDALYCSFHDALYCSFHDALHMISKTVLDVSLIPIHYGEMTSLPEGNPDVFEYFQSKVFSVHIGDHNPFGQIPADQTMTETVNKETQTAGETQGFSLKPRGSASNQAQLANTASLPSTLACV